MFRVYYAGKVATQAVCGCIMDDVTAVTPCIATAPASPPGPFVVCIVFMDIVLVLRVYASVYVHVVCVCGVEGVCP